MQDESDAAFCKNFNTNVTFSEHYDLYSRNIVVEILKAVKHAYFLLLYTLK